MSAYSNLQSEPTPVDRLVRQVVAACAKHGVAYGSPDDLRGFLRALDTNKHLAMDFWSMVARMSERGAVEEPDWLLKIVVEALTGQTLASLTAQGSTYQQPIHRLRSLLVGEDVRPPAPTERKPVQATYSRATPYPLDPVPKTPSPYIAGRRLSLEPDPPAATSAARAPDSEASHRELNWIIPLESYSDSNRNSRRSGGLVLGALAAVVLFGCTAFAVRYHERLGNSIHAATSAAVGAWNHSPSVPAPPSAPKPATNAPSTQLQPTGHPPDNTASLSPTHAPAPASDAQPSDRPASNRTTTDQPGDSDSPMPATGGGRVVVSEILMRQNLISSPTPASAYGRDHGRVVMQAIVTKHGNVSHIHVVSGDSALRQTAIDAALSRRYQPYLLNGTPVDVSTTITLDF